MEIRYLEALINFKFISLVYFVIGCVTENMLPQPEFAATLRRLVRIPANAANLTGKSEYLMEKFNIHQVTLGIKKSIKQQNLKQKKDIAPKSKEFCLWILWKVIDNDKNNSLNI